MTGRACENCGRPIAEGRTARFCNARCRAQAWKRRTGYGRPPEELPNGVLAATAKRAAAERARRRHPSGLQVSYRRAVKAVVDNLAVEVGPWGSREELERAAERWLAEALPEKQRRRLREAGR